MISSTVRNKVVSVLGVEAEYAEIRVDFNQEVGFVQPPICPALDSSLCVPPNLTCVCNYASKVNNRNIVSFFNFNHSIGSEYLWSRPG